METFYDVVAGNQLVLVDFFATWCQPCKMMYPILKQVKDVLGDRIRIIKIDVDTHSVLSQKYQIQSVPTLVRPHPPAVPQRKSALENQRRDAEGRAAQYD